MQKSFLRIFFQFRNTVPFQRFPKSAYGYGHIQVPGDCKHGFHLSGLFPQLFQHPVKLKDIQMQYHPQIIRKDIQRISTNLSLISSHDPIGSPPQLPQALQCLPKFIQFSPVYRYFLLLQFFTYIDQP